MELLAWQHNAVANAVVLLGGDWYHPAVGRLFHTSNLYNAQPEHIERCESSVRAVWDCVVTERMPPTIASVAAVLPVIALPELVTEYVFGSAVSFILHDVPLGPFRRIVEGSR
jgi:hypothetical protein